MQIEIKIQIGFRKTLYYFSIILGSGFPQRQASKVLDYGMQIREHYQSRGKIKVGFYYQMISETSSAEFSDPNPKTITNKIPEPSQVSTKLNKNFYQRTMATILMLAGFIMILIGGQTYCGILVLFVNFLMFRELNSLKRNSEKQNQIPLTGYLNWYIYLIVNYYAMGTLIEQKFPYLRVQNPETFEFLLKYHTIITCILSISAFVLFVLSLNQKYLKYQFKMFGWIIISAFLVIYPSYYAIKNCFEGMFWFVMPVLLIVLNDIFAYLFGYFFGKRQLIAISPKKTWEGYIGGAISTLIFTAILTSLFQQIPGITCRLFKPTLIPMYFQQCQEPLLKSAAYLPFGISQLAGHMILIGLFASIIGPFGGFFASGLKRSIKIKDFADFIPGHGGVSDRMDCQFLIAAFMYFYLRAFVRFQSEASVLGQWVSNLTLEEKIQIHNILLNDLQSSF